MNATEFFLQHNGAPIDFDLSYGPQCVDVYRQYCKEVLNVAQQSPGVPCAYQIWTTFRVEDFDKIENTPAGVPQLGDVVIWDHTPNMLCGHVAIFKEGNADTFISFDQNWPLGSFCHFESHNYANVLGWLRPKNLEEIEPDIVDHTTIDLGEPWGVMDVQTIKNTLNRHVEIIERLENRGFWPLFRR